MRYIYISLCRHRQRKSDICLRNSNVTCIRDETSHGKGIEQSNSGRVTGPKPWTIAVCKAIIGSIPVYRFLLKRFKCQSSRGIERVASRKLIETRAKVKLVHLSLRDCKAKVRRRKMFEDEAFRDSIYDYPLIFLEVLFLGLITVSIGKLDLVV